MPQVQMPGGDVLDFPDDMSDADMHAAINTHYFKIASSPIHPTAPIPMLGGGGSRVNAPASFEPPAPRTEPQKNLDELTGAYESRHGLLGLSPEQGAQADVNTPTPGAEPDRGLGRGWLPAFNPVKGINLPVTADEMAAGGDALQSLDVRDIPALWSDPARQRLMAKLGELPDRGPTTAEKVLAGGQQTAAGMIDFFTSPAGIATLGTAGLPAALQRGVAAGFAALMLKDYPAQWREVQSAIKAGDTERISRAITSTGLSAAMILGAGKHAFGERNNNAISERSTAEVPLGQTPGNRPTMGEGISRAEEPAPAQAQEAAGIPAAKEVLAPHEELAQKLASDAGKSIEWADLGPNRISQPGPGDTIRMSKAELGKLLEGRNPEEVGPLIQDKIDHEIIHGATPGDVALDYLNSKTPLQRKMGLRRYGGAAETRQPVSDVNLGHELLRFDLQQLLGKTPTEILDAKGKEWLTVKLITAADRMIDAARKALGTEASKNQARILGEMEQKVNLGRQALGMPQKATADTDEGQLAVPTEDAPFAVNKDKEAPFSHYEYGQPKFKVPGARPGWFSQLNAEEAAKRGYSTPEKFPSEAEWKASPEAIGSDIGWSFKEGGAMKLEGLPPEVASQIPKQWEFTDRRKGSPTEGLTFYVPEGASREAIVARMNEKVAGEKAATEQGPAATRKPKPGEGQEELKLTAAPNVERPTAEELARNEPVSPAKLEPLVNEHLERGNPSFSKFAEEAAVKHGPIQPGQLREVWLDAGRRKLMTDSGATLRKMADRLGLNRKPLVEGRRSEVQVPNGIIPDPVDEPSVSSEAAELERRQKREALTARVTRMEVKLASARQTYRSLAEVWKRKPPGAARDAAAADAREALRRAKEMQAIVTRLDAESKAPSQIELLPKASKGAPILSGRGIRENAIARIYEVLAKQTETKPNLRRNKVEPEDIGWWRAKEGVPAFQEFAPGEKVSNDTLSAGGALDRTGIKAPPESASKRITAIRDNRTGNVEFVSTYRASRGQTYIVDPGNPGAARPHVPVDDLLQRTLGGKKRYSVAGSMLLDEAAQGFHQRLTAAQWKEFSATAMEELQRQNEASENFPSVTEAEAERPALRTGSTLTDAEAGALLDHIMDTVGTLDSPDRMTEVIDALRVKAEATKNRGPSSPTLEEDESGAVKKYGPQVQFRSESELSKRDWVVIAALEKAADETQRRNRALSPLQALELTLSTIYENATTAANRESFVRKALSEFSKKPAETVQPRKETPEATGRELTMLDRRPPTDVAAGFDPDQPGAIRKEEGLESEQFPAMRTGYNQEDLLSVPDYKPLPLSPITDAQRRWMNENAGRVEENLFADGTRVDIEVRPDGLHAKATNPAVKGTGIARSSHAGKDILSGNFNSPALSSEHRQLGAIAARAVLRVYQEGLREQHESSFPAAIRKGGDIGAAFEKSGKGIRALWRRGPVNLNIAGHLDSFINQGNNEARRLGNGVRIQASNPKERLSLERGAAIRVVEARGDKANLAPMLANVQAGIVAATDLATNGESMLERYQGRKWKTAAERMEREIAYAETNWDKTSLKRTALRGKEALDEIYEFDKNRGVKLDYRGGYVPGRYEGEVFNDNVLQFGNIDVLGKNWRKAKAFPNYAEAMKEGYIPVNSDLADLVEHRARQSWREGGKDLWLTSLKDWMDPDSGDAIVKDLVRKYIPGSMRRVTNPKTGQVSFVQTGPQVEFNVPGADYVKFSLGPGKEVVAVRRGYKDLLDVLTMQGHISKTVAGDAALRLTGVLKHGVILIFDTFHPGRLGQYSFGLSNKPGYSKGFHVLEYAEKDMQQAADKGLIPQSSVDWAKGTIDVRLPGGRTSTMTRREIISFGEKEGLNVGRIQDALYKEAVKNWPLIGALNRFTFDRLTRGLMAGGVVSEFERLNKAFPDLDRQGVMRKVVRDLNRYYGNLGNQGVFRNPTIKEINQLLFLAPQWVEGLLQKEIRFTSRSVTGPYNAARNLFVEDAEKRIPFGTIGRGMGRGLAAYFALTQAINLITRRHTTFQNPEHDHKLDAWIPGGDKGFFLSPLSVFAEVSHDLIRYAEQKPMFAQAVNQIGQNKLGPWGRLALIIGTQRNGQGQKITTTPSVYREAALQMVPFAGASPISISKLAREAGHAIAPSTVAANPPGSVQRQLMGSLGIKVEPAGREAQQIYKKAQEFAVDHGYQSKGWSQEQTDEPSYSKLRTAIHNGDEASALRIIEEIKKTRSIPQIVRALHLHVTRPLTGSRAHEAEFLSSLSAGDVKAYEAAAQERKAEFEQALRLLDKAP